MGSIRIEFVPVRTLNLGFFGFDHLQLTYEEDPEIINAQDYWYVLEGTYGFDDEGSVLDIIGGDGRTLLSAVNGAGRDDLVALIGTPESRGARVLLDDVNALTTWDQMAAYARQIDAQGLPYIPISWPFGPTPTINSTSFVASVLYAAGFNLGSVLPFGLRLSPGGGTLIGTTGDDDLAITGDFTTLVAGYGNDHLSGSNNVLFLDKLYGGAGDDTITWSAGDNIVHGGQKGIAYAQDGFDTVDYSGAGTVHIISTRYAVQHKTPDFIATFDTGSDQLFSIEQISWTAGSDVIVLGQGVDLIERPLKLGLGGEGSGQGDTIDFSDASGGLFVNSYDNYTIVQASANAGSDAGFWAQSAEWVITSDYSDTIYAGPATRGVGGGGGGDLIDARLVAAFSGDSPSGYDIEIDGGDGNDTIVGGGGRTYAVGGAGADTFILSATSNLDISDQVEFIIADATSDDRLLLPYDFFAVERGDYEGSELMQLLGAPFQLTQSDPISYFAWGLPDENEIEGYITFVGLIEFEMDGDDLVIRIYQGDAETYIDGSDVEYTIVAADTTTETIVRVLDWSDGDLGITFKIEFNFTTFSEAGSFQNYPGYQQAVIDSVDMSFDAPLDARPAGHLPAELMDDGNGGVQPPDIFEGTEDPDLIIATGLRSNVSAGGGDDDVTGTDGGDVLDGGAGEDMLTGGRGNDTYIVDNAGDLTIEAVGEGFDSVRATVSFTLQDNVENLALTGAAVSATGNALANRLEGNDGDNELYGLDGDDTLSGGGGDDHLIGGNGSDGYVYARGDGHDRITDSPGSSSGDDVLILTGGIAAADVTLVRRPGSAGDVALIFATGSVTLEGFLSGGGVSRVVFDDGTEWTRATLETLADAAPTSDNFAPVAEDDVYIATGTGSYLIPAALLLGNDRDADNDTLSIVAISDFSHGSATIQISGDILYTPSSSGPPSVTFVYTISDGQGGLASANAEFALIENAAPVITPGAVLTVAAGGLADGTIEASDPEDSALAYALKDGFGPAQGTVTFTSGGAFSYEADEAASGTDTFTVLVIDTLGGTAEEIVTVAIGEVFSGTSADETFSGTAGNDTFYGNSGNDTFVFASSSGDDTIADFDLQSAGVSAADLIDVSAFAFTDFTDLATHFSQDGADAVIALDGLASVRLAGIAASALQATDFVL